MLSMPEYFGRAYEEIKKYGKKLTQSGNAAGHGGNISVRIDDKIYITKHGGTFEEIKLEDIVEVDINTGKQNALVGGVAPSVELAVHKAIYLTSDENSIECNAVLHTHSKYSTILSLSYNEITPANSPSRNRLEKILVVTGKGKGSPKLVKNVSKAIKKYKTVIAKEHGIFARGKDLEDAYRNVIATELAAEVFYKHVVLEALLNK